MIAEAPLQEKEAEREFTGVHPKKFALWLAMASMTMFFAALTSALVVKKADVQAWENFRLPTIFLYSTGVIVLVSALMHFSLMQYRKAGFGLSRVTFIVAFILAVVFLLMQWMGWKVLMAMGLPLDGNLSGSFIYLITFFHGLHIVGGLAVGLIFMIGAIRSRNDALFELKGIANPTRQLNLELIVSYWHYIDIVWIYLYVFFYFNYQ